MTPPVIHLPRAPSPFDSGLLIGLALGACLAVVLLHLIEVLR